MVAKRLARKKSTVVSATGAKTILKVASPKAKAKADAVASLRAAQAREKAAKTVAKKTNAAKAKVATQSLHVNIMDKDMDYIISWLEDRPHLVSFVASCMRNGMLESDFTAQQNAIPKGVLRQLGDQVFTEGAKTWKQLKPAKAVAILDDHFQDLPIKEWFSGDDGLPKSIAVKACIFEQGVHRNTAVPTGIDYALFHTPSAGFSSAA